MSRRVMLVLFVVVLSLMVAVPAALADRGGTGGRGDGPVIFVRNQGLFYDSIVTADPVPWEGRFQKLEPTANGLETDFGPGDVGYVGGRWWIDVDEDGMQDAKDHYFLCPLLGPGRLTP